jgi:hypothetical protein
LPLLPIQRVHDEHTRWAGRSKWWIDGCSGLSRRSSVRALLCLNDASSSSSSPKWAAPAAFGGTKPARAYAMPRALAHAATKRDLVAKE